MNQRCSFQPVDINTLKPTPLSSTKSNKHAHFPYIVGVFRPISGKMSNSTHIYNFPTDEVPLMSVWDKLLALTLLLCTLLGLPGNLLAFTYFWSTSKRDLATLLYLTISVVDICISVIHLPVMISLFDSRKAGLFSGYLFCVAWSVVFDFLQKVSLFLVLLLSVSRTVSIRCTFVRVDKSIVLGVFLCYISLFVLHKSLISLYGITIGFGNDGPYCYSWFSHSKAWAVADRVTVCAQVGIPSIVTFFSFTISTSYLSSPSVRGVGSRAVSASKRANMTVAIFTAVFLICNLPYFAIKVLEISNYIMTNSGFESGYPGLFFRSDFMFWYSWTLSHIIFTVLNATFNPVIYYFRFRKFRIWLGKSVSQIDNRLSSAVLDDM